MSPIYYFSLFDELLKFHSSELSHLSEEKAKITSLLLTDLISQSNINDQDQLLKFLQWIFIDLNRKIFMEKQCSIMVEGYCETLKVLILIHSIPTFID